MAQGSCLDDHSYDPGTLFQAGFWRVLFHTRPGLRLNIRNFENKKHRREEPHQQVV